ncbi:MAG: DMT family transporter [Ignavibacteriales bacterium]|nr:DMT family transporter [Ignavibacteriales bacterium]
MSSRTRAELLLLSITLIWGSTFVTSKYLLDSISPLIFIGVRFSVATVLFALFFPRKVFAAPRNAWIKGGILGVLLFIGFATQTIGLQYTGATKSAFITGMMVVFTPICQLLIERRAPKTGNIVGILLVTAGLYFLTSPGGSEFNLGDGLNLICAVTFGFYIVYLDVFSKEVDAVHLIMAQFIVCAVLGLASGFTFEAIRFVPSVDGTLALLYLIVFATIIALFVQNRYQKDTTPTRSAVIFSIEPVLAAGFAYVLLGEVLGALGVFGGALIVGGVLVSELSPG